MEIRKADSKGRVTGFEPGRYYQLTSKDNGIFARLVSPGGYLHTYPMVYELRNGEAVIPRDQIINGGANE